MRVTFQLRHSDRASTFNVDHHGDTLIGETIMRHDGLVVVNVPGWRWGHTVKREHVTPAGRENRWYAARLTVGAWIVQSPRRLSGDHAYYAYTTGAEALSALAGGGSRG